MDDPYPQMPIPDLDFFKDSPLEEIKGTAPPAKVEDPLIKAALSDSKGSLHNACVAMPMEADHFTGFEHWWDYYNIGGAFSKRPKLAEIQHYHLAAILALNGDMRRAWFGSQAIGDDWWLQLDNAMQTIKRASMANPQVARFKALLRI